MSLSPTPWTPPAPSHGAKATALVCTDVVIIAKADGSTARAHRGVLATFSSVFRHALAPDLPGNALAGEAKKDERGHFQLPLPNKNRHHLDQLMAFLYPCDSRHEQFNSNNIVSYIDLAEEYDMPLMKAACERWLLKELQNDRVMHLTSRQPSNTMPPGMSPRAREASLAVQLLERAHTCNLHTFLAEAIWYLVSVNNTDLIEMLETPEAATLPAPVLR